MEPGDRIGSFVVERRLGAGQMGVVYAVRRDDLGARYALKVLRRELCSARDLLRFQREVQHLAAVSTHPRVVPIHTAGEDRGALYYVMDLIEGQTLQERLDRGGAMRPDVAARYVRDVADALTALHRAGVVHRDIKPANILVDARLDAARLADFGLARSFLDERGRLTHTGELVGTPHFMAPEQALGHPVGPAADVYALGMVLFTLLAGRPAVSGKGLLDVLTRVGSGELERLPTLAPDTPEALVALIEASLHLDPARRPEARAVREGLEAFLRAPGDERRARAPSRPWALIGLGAAALGAVGLAVAAVASRRRPVEQQPAPVAAVATRSARPTPPPPPPRAAPAWLQDVPRGDLATLRAALAAFDAAGPDPLSDRERRDLTRHLNALNDAWRDPLAGDLSSVSARPPAAAGDEVERLILIHALLRRLDPAHRLPTSYEALFQPTYVALLGWWVERVNPRVLAELAALRPDDVNVYMLYVDGNKNPFDPDARDVDLEVFRRGMAVARTQGLPKPWGRMVRALAQYLWSFGGDAARAGRALENLRDLAREVEASGWGGEEAVEAMICLQMTLLPWEFDAWPLLPRERRQEAVEVARRAVKVAPGGPKAIGHLAAALLALDDGAPGPSLDEARQAADDFFEANGRTTERDELLTLRVAIALCSALERGGDDAAAAEACARALASCPDHPLLPLTCRRALLLCRAGAGADDLRAALEEARRRLARWAARRPPSDPERGDDLLAALEALAAGLTDGSLSAAAVSERLSAELQRGDQTSMRYALPVPRGR